MNTHGVGARPGKKERPSLNIGGKGKNPRLALHLEGKNERGMEKLFPSLVTAWMSLSATKGEGKRGRAAFAVVRPPGGGSLARYDQSQKRGITTRETGWRVLASLPSGERKRAYYHNGLD